MDKLIQEITGKDRLNVGLYLIKLADDGLSTEAIDQAIEDLQATKYARENIPF